MKPRDLRLAAVLVCAAGIAVLASCRQRGDTGADGGAAQTGPAVIGEHWVQDERLRGVMAELSRQSGHWPAGLPDDVESPDPETADAFREATALADGLARAARDIPRSVAGREMSPENRRGFNGEARRLRDHAVALKEAARGRKVERMQRALDGISSSCISCHSQYRDFAGELGARRASAR